LRILSYLSANVHRTIHVCIHRRATRPTDVQPTLHTICVTLLPTTRTRLACVSLTRTVYEDAVFLSLVFEQRGEAVEFPIVEFLVPTLTPAPRLSVPVTPNLVQVANSDAYRFRSPTTTTETACISASA
jgi:hypothetical protein